MASEEPVRMLESEPTSFELTELEAPEEELLGSFLPIGDVAKLIGVNPSVLRFWEQEFPQLRPTKRGNRRYYSSEDVSLIRTIQHLLYEEHYTILGARNKIHELQVQDKAREILDEKVSAPLPVIEEKETVVQMDMSPILDELRAIRALLTASGDVPSQKTDMQAFNEEAVSNFSLVSEDLATLIAQEEQLKAEETARIEEKSQETEELIAPHSYDLGAFGADSENFLTLSPKIGDMTPSKVPVEVEEEVVTTEPLTVVEAEPVIEEVQEAEEVEEPVFAPQPVDVEPKTEASVDEFLTGNAPVSPVETAVKEEVVAETVASQEAAKVETKTEERKVDTSRLVVPPLPGQRQAFTIGMKVPKSQQNSLTHIAPFLWGKK